MTDAIATTTKHLRGRAESYPTEEDNGKEKKRNKGEERRGKEKEKEKEVKSKNHWGDDIVLRRKAVFSSIYQRVHQPIWPPAARLERQCYSGVRLPYLSNFLSR